MSGGDGEDGPRPFPDSLCHHCAAPRYVRSATSTFILCPLVPEKYPRQPVRSCPLFRPRPPRPLLTDPE